MSMASAFPRNMGIRQSVRRALLATEAEAIFLGLSAAALRETDPQARQALIDRQYLWGAKADLLDALSDGHLRRAREALACWRCLHRAVHGRKGGRA
ncbi:MAG: hypothetical protein K2X46_15055 [Roseomonas sp.]|nr:hypothetical protein [Roseomonas sp.]